MRSKEDDIEMFTMTIDDKHTAERGFLGRRSSDVVGLFGKVNRT